MPLTFPPILRDTPWGPFTNIRFPGQWADAETGLSYNYFRDYDPTLGRYIESDPIGLGGGLNTFGYVAGNPIIRIDNSGLFDFVGHYFGGSGTTVNLGAVGLLGAFRSAPSVQSAVAEFKALLDSEMAKEATNRCLNCSSGRIKSGNFNLSDSTVTDVTNEPGLFAVGQSTFFREGACNYTIDCVARTYRMSCKMTFSIRDWFRDPLSLGFEVWPSVPYRINAKWSQGYTATGKF